VFAGYVHRRCSILAGRAEETVVEIYGGKKARTAISKISKMKALYEDPWFTFRFADDRIIYRFHLEGIEAGRKISVCKIDPGTGERLCLLAMATVGEGGWVDLGKPIMVRAGDAFIAEPDPE
jgi:hypothetical protein